MSLISKTYSRLPPAIAYIISSVIALAVDYLLRFILLSVFGVEKEAGIHICSTMLSSLVNFNLNKFLVFRKNGTYLRDLISYYCICLPRTAVSVVVTSIVIDRIRNVKPLLAVVAGLVVDGVLFVLCYFLQKIWVFKPEKKNEPEK